LASRAGRLDPFSFGPGVGAICLHRELLRQQPEHVVSDSDRLAGGSGANLLPDPLGRAPGRNRLEQRRTHHDLHRQTGIRHTFPNCGDPNNLSLAFPLDYERPSFAIGVAWPNAKNYRYEMQSVPIIDGPDGTCTEFSNRPGQVTNWWVYELKEPKRGSYVFTATVSFQKDDKGYYAVLNSCKLNPPSSAAQ
jgi:hypothetical protein